VSEPQLQCSFFTHALDNRPKPFCGTWADLVHKLEQTYRPRLVEGDPKKGLPAIAPATFEPLHRGKDEAQLIHLVGLDFDNAREEVVPREFHKSGTPKTRKVMIENPVTIDEVADLLWDAEAAGYLWSTWSNLRDWPKFRAVVPLGAPVPAGQWKQASEYALHALGLTGTRRGLDLGALRDVARIYFLPGHAEGSEAISRTEVDGRPLLIPLDELPKVEVPELPRLPHVEREIQRRRNAGYAWAAGLPVELATLRLADLMASLGVKVGPGQPYKSGTKWRTHCLWPSEHGGAVDDDCGAVIQEPGRWPSWHCKHACHGHLGLEDVLRAAGVVR